MKSVAVRMPQMGQSAAEGTIVKWHKRMGETVQLDELLVEVESDKINFEVESPTAGRLTACLKEGRVVPVGDVIAMIEAPEASPGDPAAQTPAAPPAMARPHHGHGVEQELVSTRAMPERLDAAGLSDAAADWLSPSVMRLALMNNISVADLSQINGSGRGGRITREDVLALIGRRNARPTAAHQPLASSPEDTVIPMTTMRRTIADHMVQSIHTSAHVTMVHTVDMTGVVALRNRLKDGFLKRNNIRMSYTAVFTFVTARVLREFPSINASVSGTNIIQRRHVNIGCAVALPDESLVVPVVKDADQKTFLEIAAELSRVIDLARTRSLTPADVQGGTFTISNFGAFGSIIGTPLIHQPQVAILGMGAIARAPVVVGSEICIRDITHLSFSFDHRVIDGAMGGRFLNRVQQTVEALDEQALGIPAEPA